jgi:hypothetical protein
MDIGQQHRALVEVTTVIVVRVQWGARLHDQPPGGAPVPIDVPHAEAKQEAKDEDQDVVMAIAEIERITVPMDLSE